MTVINYATLAQVKDYLGISWTSEDTVLQQLLDSSYYIINNLLNVDTLNETTGIEQVDAKNIYSNVWYYWYNIFLKNKPVSAVTKINWTSYAGAKGTDYIIVYDRKVVIKDLYNYITNLQRDYFDIEYTRWYDRDLSWTTPWPNDTLPDDIKLLQMMLVSGKYNTKWSEWLKQYKLWEETITFGTINWQSADDIFFSFKIILDKYKSFILP